MLYTITDITAGEICAMSQRQTYKKEHDIEPDVLSQMCQMVNKSKKLSLMSVLLQILVENVKILNSIIIFILSDTEAKVLFLFL